MKFVAVVIVFAIVPGHSFNKRFGSNRIRLCFGKSSQITKRAVRALYFVFARYMIELVVSANLSLLHSMFLPLSLIFLCRRAVLAFNFQVRKMNKMCRVSRS